MKNAFFLDSVSYDYLRGTLMGLCLIQPAKYNEAATLVNKPTSTTAVRGTEFELGPRELEVILEAVAHHYMALKTMALDPSLPTMQKENMSHDSSKLLTIAQAILDQGIENGSATGTKFEGGRFC